MQQRWRMMSLIMLAGVIGSLLTGCRQHGFDGAVEALSFSHPDETKLCQDSMIVADRRIFAVMAWLNAVGYDEEAEGVAMHPVRETVRETLAPLLAKFQEQHRAWQQYYQRHDYGTWVYQDFALSLTADYPFERIRPDAELGYPGPARALKEFPAILNEFWVAVNLEAVWEMVKPAYLQELNQYDCSRMARQREFLWNYLRLPRRDTLTLAHVPNLLDQHYSAIWAQYEHYGYSVESPGSHDYGLNVHEYLHSIVNPLVRSEYPHYAEKLDAYYHAGRNGPLSQTYQNPVTFAYESLVRALDNRIRAHEQLSTWASAENKSQGETSQGLTLVLPFYQGLANYEGDSRNFQEYLPMLLEELPAL